MSRKFYIAYGSNLNVQQMKDRCPGAIQIGSTVLMDYRITFRSNRKTGVANIEPRKGSHVPVGIWSITESDECNLDRYEGYPTLYTKKIMTIKLPDLRTVPAIVYVMTPKKAWRNPSHSYLHTIRQGYKDFGFCDRRLMYAASHPMNETN